VIVRISTYFAVIGNCVSRKYGGLPIPSALANVGNTRPSPQSSVISSRGITFDLRHTDDVMADSLVSKSLKKSCNDKVSIT